MDENGTPSPHRLIHTTTCTINESEIIGKWYIHIEYRSIIDEIVCEIKMKLYVE